MKTISDGSTGRGGRNVHLRRIYRCRSLYLMLLLPAIYFAVFKIAPVFGLQIAFQNFRVRQGFFGSQWVGLKHFKQYMSEPYFWILVRNTLLLGFETIVFTFPVPIILALLLNEIGSMKVRNLIQNIVYLPHFISTVVIASMVTTFLASDGLINRAIIRMGGESYLYLHDPNWFRPVYLISGIWQTMGWNAIIYIAALTAVDQELYEAAIVDGAGRWKQTLHITLPSILPTISIMLIMAVGKIMNVSFEKILLLQNPLTYDTSDVISTYVYRIGLSGGQYSYSTAIDLFSTVTNFLLLQVTNQICRRLGETSLW